MYHCNVHVLCTPVRSAPCYISACALDALVTAACVLFCALCCTQCQPMRMYMHMSGSPQAARVRRPPSACTCTCTILTHARGSTDLKCSCASTTFVKSYPSRNNHSQKLALPLSGEAVQQISMDLASASYMVEGASHAPRPSLSAPILCFQHRSRAPFPYGSLVSHAFTHAPYVSTTRPPLLRTICRM